MDRECSPPSIADTAEIQIRLWIPIKSWKGNSIRNASGKGILCRPNQTPTLM